MTKLTPAIIQKVIKGNAKIDQKVDYSEPGKALIYLTDGWTWEALDGNRSCEWFNLSNYFWEEADTISYLKERIKSIEPINPEYY
jgi:hypothetical protein